MALFLISLIVLVYYIFKFFSTQEKTDSSNPSIEIKLERIPHRESQEYQQLMMKYRDSKIEDVIFNKNLNHEEKIAILSDIFNLSLDEIEELEKMALKEQRDAKLSTLKQRISQKAREMYGKIPSDDKREPIPDDVKLYVWNRDNGKCVKCGSNEKLEYDHIIPVSKGGSNTARNIQLLCEKCNRSKHDSIT